MICEYLEAQYPSPPLLPADAATAAKVRLFVDAFSSQFVPAFFGLYRADTPEAVAAGKQKLESVFKVSSSVGWCAQRRWWCLCVLRGSRQWRGCPQPSLASSTAQHSTAQHSTAQHSTENHCPQLCCTVGLLLQPVLLLLLLLLLAGLQVLDSVLLLHGSEEGGDLFLGGQYSMAEVACTGLLQRGIVTLPAYRGIDLWELVRSHKLER